MRKISNQNGSKFLVNDLKNQGHVNFYVISRGANSLEIIKKIEVMASLQMATIIRLSLSCYYLFLHKLPKNKYTFHYFVYFMLIKSLLK